MSGARNRSRFVVDLGDVKLPEAVRTRLNQKIQRVVLDELAGLDFGDVAFRLPREWYGIWVRLIKPGLDLGREFDDLEQKIGSPRR